MIPPSGIASIALNIKLVSASRTSLSTPMKSRQFRRQFALHLDDDAALLRHVAPARTRQIDHLLHQFDSSESERARVAARAWR